MAALKSNIQSKLNDSFLRKLTLMTLVVFSVYIILGIIGFFLWFAFPVEVKNGLSYLVGNSLIFYYIIVNFMDIVGILLLSHIIYYRFINTTTPIKDGAILGLYLIIFSWLLDLVVYVFIRKTLPSIQEYFLGKNQPEIGIAWLIAYISALCSGYLHVEKRNFVRNVSYRKLMYVILILALVSTLLTIVGIQFFDIKP
ncbi:MAG: hypothetical protein JXB49_26120 [Bacteroidales bacterium]|nr:hypothetical protein [Bacteroidales bacterium]